MPQGFYLTEIAGIRCYMNQSRKLGTDWYSDGSKATAQRARVVITCGNLKVLARVLGPQCSYQAELIGAVLVAVLAEDGDTLVCGNKAAVDHSMQPPRPLNADTDMRRALLRELGTKEVPFRWVSSHCDVKGARDEQDMMDIIRNDKVDRLGSRFAG